MVSSQSLLYSNIPFLNVQYHETYLQSFILSTILVMEKIYHSLMFSFHMIYIRILEILWFCPLVCLFGCLCAQTVKYLSICLFVFPFVCSNSQTLSVCLFVCLFVCSNSQSFVCFLPVCVFKQLDSVSYTQYEL